MDSKGQNPICKTTLKRKSDENSIPKVRGYAKTVNIRISKINIMISDYVNKVYARPNEVFNKIKGASKRARN